MKSNQACLMIEAFDRIRSLGVAQYSFELVLQPLLLGLPLFEDSLGN